MTDLSASGRNGPAPTRDGLALRALYRARWWIAACVLLGAIATYVVQSSRPDVYSSTAIVRVVTAGQDTGVLVQPDALAQITNAYAEYARAPSIRDTGGFPRSAKLDLQVATDADSTGLLRFSADARDGRTAADAAGRFAQRFSDALSRLADGKRAAALRHVNGRIAVLEKQLESDSGNGPTQQARQAELLTLRGKAADIQTQEYDQAQLISAPAVPESPSSPSPRRDAVIVGLLVLAAAIAVIYARALASPRFRSAAEAADTLGLELLGEIPRAGRRRATTDEAFRLLRARFDFALEGLRGSAAREGFAQNAARPLTIVIAATDSGSGKTYVSIGLARSLAVAGARVRLVDGDLRKPDIHRRLNLEPVPGLIDLLRNSAADVPAHSVETLSAVTDTAVALEVVPSGGALADSSELLAAANLGTAVSRLGQDSSTVLIDTPPLSSVADAALFAHAADGVLFVLDASRSKRTDVMRAVAFLRQAGTPIVGFVMNGTAEAMGEYYGYGYGDSRGAASS